MTKTNLKWRLGKLPTPEDLVDLVNTKIITQDEARQILFTQEDEPAMADLKSEIKFLRQLVDKLANNSRIVTTIREIQTPTYIKYPWWNTYNTWCQSIPATSSVTLTSDTTSSTTNAFYSNLSNQAQLSSTGKNFSEIETF